MTRFEIMKNKLAAEYAALDDQSVDERERGDKVILVTAAVCAGIAVQPLPFADIATYIGTYLYIFGGQGLL